MSRLTGSGAITSDIDKAIGEFVIDAYGQATVSLHAILDNTAAGVEINESFRFYLTTMPNYYQDFTVDDVVPANGVFTTAFFSDSGATQPITKMAKDQTVYVRVSYSGLDTQAAGVTGLKLKNLDGTDSANFDNNTLTFSAPMTNAVLS